jgi:lipopolysaccharide transport system ATP-binding protein
MAHAIEIDGLGKRYRLGEDFRRYLTIRESLASWPRRRSRGVAPELWALRDVGFSVEEGDALGIIGRNGAGKTTLLKILSRITEPTTGVARTRGRVGTLLDVGTGFHPELTGRENVYLNGAILGLRRAEMNRKFEEIVAFAGVDRFLDTPVKRYSSGMQTRLAFSVAAHIEPEILIVDEVLAVGDAAFQRRCLGKMTDAASQGRTVVFVSHNMTAVEGLCGRAIWLDGSIVDEGSPPAVTARYLSESSSENLVRRWPNPATAPGNDQVRLRGASIVPAGSSEAGAITVRTPTVLTFEYWNLVLGADLTLSVHLRNEQGVVLFNTGPVGGRPLDEGLYRSSCVVPGDLLNDGRHHVELQIIKDEGMILHSYPDLLVFDVIDSLVGRGAYYGEWPGAVRPLLEWHTELVRDGVTTPP